MTLTCYPVRPLIHRVIPMVEVIKFKQGSVCMYKMNLALFSIQVNASIALVLGFRTGACPHWWPWTRGARI